LDFCWFWMQDYDIVIWSATSMKWIEEKMKLLGVQSHPSYKIAFYLDYLAMISVHTQKYGVIDVSHRTYLEESIGVSTLKEDLSLFALLMAGKTLGSYLGKIFAVQCEEYNHDRRP
jgi:hypothetical protein